MPGFVKTPKDEARWSKAKEAAGKETKEGSESYWKLSNYIYHKMGKTEEDQKLSELYKSEITNDFQSGKELSVENLRRFMMNDTAERQSYSYKRGLTMADEKKYSAQEAAIALLNKAKEVIQKHAAAAHPVAPLAKAEPVGEIHPKEQVQGEPAKPGARIESQKSPDMNPKEQAEGNNKEWGTAPETYSTLKLAKFLGHMQSKRKQKLPGQP